MSFAFHGKRVVVTGGSKGIGRAIALAFVGAGAAVSACARGAQALESTRADIALAGVKAHAGVCDLADGLAVTRYVAEAGAALGGIDMPVNNASGFGLGDDEAAWARRKRLPKWHSSWPRLTRAGSLARLLQWTAGSCWEPERYHCPGQAAGPGTAPHEPLRPHGGAALKREGGCAAAPIRPRPLQRPPRPTGRCAPPCRGAPAALRHRAHSPAPRRLQLPGSSRRS